MNGRVVPAALIGAGAGLHLVATARILDVLFWPRAGGALFLLTLLGAAVGAAALFLTKDRRKEEKGDDGRGWIFLLWGAAASGALLAMAAAVERGRAGIPDGPGDFPAVLVFSLALPPALASAALLREGAPSGGRIAPFLISLGAALGVSSTVAVDPVFLGLAGVLLGTFPALRSVGKGAFLQRTGAILLLAGAVYLLTAGYRDDPGRPGESTNWSRQGKLAVVEGADGWGIMDVSGGLRQIMYRAPSARPPAFHPRPGADGTIDVISIGFPRADLLRWLLRKEASVVVHEPDRILAEEIRRRRPDLNSDGKVQFHEGDLRRFLAGKEGTFDLVILGAAPTPVSYLSSATAFREDYTTTVEAFRTYIRALAPKGLLFSERPGNGRVVTTLREAAQPGAIPFSRQVVVMGRKRRLVTQCWFSPSGFAGGDLKRMNSYTLRKGLEIFISPQTRRNWSLYYNLVHGDTVRGYYFTTSRDLSPARDDRPFFGHYERLMISPTGKALPEELGLWEEEWGLRFIPPGDRALWLIPAAGLLLLPLMILLPAAVMAHRNGLARHGMRYPWIFLLLGLSLSAALRALAGYGHLSGSAGGGGIPTTAIFLAASGAGWMLRPPRDAAWRRAGIPLALLLAVMGIGGYAVESPRGMTGAFLVILLASLTGLAAGRLSGSLLHSADDVLEGTLPWYASFLLLGAVTGWALSTLAAVFFGFPVIWLVAGAGLLTAARAGRKL